MIVDIWPRDRASRCYADMTRTFVSGGGEPPAELLEFWTLTRESLQRVYADVRAGASGRKLYERSCEPYIEAGQPTQLTKEPGRSWRTATSMGWATAWVWRYTSARGWAAWPTTS